MCRTTSMRKMCRATMERKMSRTTRKRKMNMAEAFDLLDERADESYSKTKSKKWDHGGRVSSARTRGSLINIASARLDDKQPAVACGNIKEDTSKMRGRKQIVGRTPASKTPALEVPTDEEEEEEIEDEEDDNGDVESGEGNDDDYDDEDDDEDDDDDDDDEDSNAVKIGQFLIAKSDMKRLEKYPIWRKEWRTTWLHKFEMIVQDGAVRHKSSNTFLPLLVVSVLSDLYEKIQVNQISSQDGETIVEISQDCVPKPQDLSRLEEKHSSDQLLPAYIIYVDAMFHQAVDSSFLRKINMDNDFQHYVNAINHVDVIIRDQISSIETDVNMQDEFKSRVRYHPTMTHVCRQNWSETDQAIINKSSEIGVCSVHLFGNGYDPFVLEEDKFNDEVVDEEIVIGSTMEKYLLAYHGLMHFKYTLFKRCQDKVKLTSALEPGEDVYVLEKCLQDRTWILQTFEDLKNLLANENLHWR